MKDLLSKENLDSYDRAIDEAKASLEKKYGFKIKSREIQCVLQEALNIESEDELLKIDITSEKILNLLSNYEFRQYEMIQLDKSIIPEDIQTESIFILAEETLKNKGEVWFIHKNDQDPFPSNPHAHNAETSIKLDLSNGNLYKKRKLVGKISLKQLKKIRGKVNNIELPPLNNQKKQKKTRQKRSKKR